MKRHRLHLAALVQPALVGAGAAAFDWPDWATALADDDQRVLVFMVGDREGVDRVRAAVDPERIVAETPDAVALREGRIVAVDVDAVPAPFTAAGWMDREIEIMHLQRVEWWKGNGAEPGETRIAGKRDDEARMARIRELLGKQRLTDGEQLFLLQAMNDGIEF
jgi:hypothetical protein